ncbi:hypothetical protein [Piscirickettsia litoralis]|uniref:Uncharacterized protein n=1 Tax=Piscirickettsia litoralis TaxID=1891921 RepID=A0ABX3A5G1_9GAMM|nr:hypothetical protein [Piscirickettsia litoralis]ODN43447.1 hypothetical protein BGC07_11610 [Piscirickettsia litoralis]
MGKLFSDARQQDAAIALAATGLVMGVAAYIKSGIDAAEAAVAEELLGIFNQTLGKVGFPAPFKLEGESKDEIHIPRELESFSFEALRYKDLYSRRLYELSETLRRYADSRDSKGDTIDKMVSYLLYIIVSPNGLVNLKGTAADIKKLDALADFCDSFATSSGANSRGSYMKQVADILPTEKDEDPKKVNLRQILKAKGQSAGSDDDFESLESASRMLADSAMRLGVMGVTPFKLHPLVGTAPQSLISENALRERVTKEKHWWNRDEPAILIPPESGQYTCHFLPPLREAARILHDEGTPSTCDFFNPTEEEISRLARYSAFKDNPANTVSYDSELGKVTSKDLTYEERKKNGCWLCSHGEIVSNYK